MALLSSDIRKGQVPLSRVFCSGFMESQSSRYLRLLNNTALSFSGSDSPGAAEMMLWQYLTGEEMPLLGSRDPENEYSKSVSFPTALALLTVTVQLSWIRQGSSFAHRSHTHNRKPSCTSPLRSCCEWEKGKKLEEKNWRRQLTASAGLDSTAALHDENAEPGAGTEGRV